MIEVESSGACWVVRLARADKANSLTAEMLSGVAAAFEQAEAQDAAAVILTGAGKVFSAGADLNEVNNGLATNPVWERASGAIKAFGGFSVAALNGTLAGGAFGMALACDVRLAVPGANFFYPVMRLGFLPQPSDPARLAALVGSARAKFILMGGQKISAQQAYEFGLIEKIVEPDALMAEAETLVAHAIDAPAEHRRAIKAMCDSA